MFQNMARQLILEIKTFSIHKGVNIKPIPFSEIAVNPLGLEKSKISNKNVISALLEFIKTSFDSLKQSEELFLSNDSKTKKFRFHCIDKDIKNSCLLGVFEGGNTNEIGNFNKRITSKQYNQFPLGSDDFTDSPFFFLIYLPINSDTGVLMIQKYSDKSLNQDFKNLFREFFRQKGFNVRMHTFLSDAMKAQFKKGAIIEKITIAQQKAGRGLQEKFKFLQESKEYKIKIEISEINSPFADVFDRLRTPQQEIKRISEMFPGLTECGIDVDKSTVSTNIHGEGAIAKVKISDLGAYMDKLIPKEIIPNEHKIVNLVNGKYDYSSISNYVIELLNNMVLVSLGQK